MSENAFKIASKAQLDDAADWLIERSGGRRKWFFYGQMGAGKTALVGALAQRLGAKGKTSSPTFSLVNRYFLNEKTAIFHLDLFRLKSLEEAIDIGIEDILYDENWAFIEWPDLIEPIAPPENLFKIRIEPTSQTSRLIEIMD